MKKFLAILIFASTFGLPSLATAADLWWAVIITGTGTDGNGYAAGWNYKTEEEAINRAKKECAGSDGCDLPMTGKNSCFMITVQRAGTLGVPKFAYWHSFAGDNPSEEEAREDFKKVQKMKYPEEWEIQLLKFVGVK